MNTTDLLARLRAKCPSFAMFDHALTSSATMDLPAGMLTPSRTVAQPNVLLGNLIFSQDTTQTFSIFILLPRKRDRGLQSKADDLDTLTAELRQGLIGYQPDGFHSPLIYAGGTLDKYHTGEICWREDFAAGFDLRITFNG
jgi:hypothetical protein